MRLSLFNSAANLSKMLGNLQVCGTFRKTAVLYAFPPIQPGRGENPNTEFAASECGAKRPIRPAGAESPWLTDFR